jgi:hypothetical protein
LAGSPLKKDVSLSEIAPGVTVKASSTPIIQYLTPGEIFSEEFVYATLNFIIWPHGWLGPWITGKLDMAGALTTEFAPYAGKMTSASLKMGNPAELARSTLDIGSKALIFAPQGAKMAVILIKASSSHLGYGRLLKLCLITKMCSW